MYVSVTFILCSVCAFDVSSTVSYLQPERLHRTSVLQVGKPWTVTLKYNGVNKALLNFECCFIYAVLKKNTTHDLL